MNQRHLTVDELRELADLNAAVITAVETRRVWLDKKMVECSKIQVGDSIFNLDTGQLLGKVTKLYRLFRNLDGGFFDTSPYCHYEYEAGPLRLDNTSRQPGLRFGKIVDIKID